MCIRDRCFTIAQLTALHSCYGLVNPVQPAHPRSHDTQHFTASTSQHRRNTTAAIHRILLRSSRRTRQIHAQLPIRLSYISYILSSPILSYPMPITQCTVLYIRCFPSSRLRAKPNGSINRYDVVTIRITSTNHNIANHS